MVNHLVFSLIGVESFGVLEAVCVPTDIRVILIAMKTGNSQEQNRMEKTEQEIGCQQQSNKLPKFKTRLIKSRQPYWMGR